MHHSKHTRNFFRSRPYGRPRRSGDEVRVEIAHASLEHRAHVDVADHASGILSGIVIWTCAPGNGARFSFMGSSWSHDGIIAILAVPLRTESLPCHAPMKFRTPASPCPRPGSLKRVPPRITASSSAILSPHLSSGR